MRTNILWVVTVTRRQTTITSYFAENILTCHKFILSLLSSELANYLSLSVSLFNLSLSLYIYIHTYIHIHKYTYIKPLRIIGLLVKWLGDRSSLI